MDAGDDEGVGGMETLAVDHKVQEGDKDCRSDLVEVPHTDDLVAVPRVTFAEDQQDEAV